MTARSSTSFDTMLHDAQQKARNLVDDLTVRQAELLSEPGPIDPGQLEAGRHALQHAIESATQLLGTLEQVKQRTEHVVESKPVSGR